MKIVVAGGTGFLGGALVRRLVGEGNSVVVLTRNPGRHRGRAAAGVMLEGWDGESSGPWQAHVHDAGAIVNLAGEPIAGGRWTPARKERLRGSRLTAARALVRAIRDSARRPAVLINASAVGYYGDIPEGDVTETAPASPDFLGELSRQWEAEAFAAKDLGVRVAVCRIGIVLGDNGGALSRMVAPFRFFVGGPLGSGRQWFPWVHRDDVVGAVVHLLQNDRLNGPFNVTAPEPVRMSEFCEELGKILHRPSWARVPEFALRLLLGEMSAVVLSGQRAVPRRLLESGYRFAYPSVGEALRDVLT